MKEKPILFSPLMVQAILAGRKTMTRRVMKPQPIPFYHGEEMIGDLSKEQPHIEWEWPTGNKQFAGEQFWADGDSLEWWKYCPYGKPKDMLWVRENFRVQEINRFFDTEWFNIVCIDFPASEGTIECRRFIRMKEADRTNVLRRRHPEKVYTSPNIHLPMNCARIWLEVTDIKVERLHDITEVDAIAEGVEPYIYSGMTSYRAYKDYLNRIPESEDDILDAVGSFKSLWESINGQDSWNSNPWVWAVSFKVLSTSGKPSTKNEKN